MERLPSSDVPPASSTTLPCPTRSLPVRVVPIHRRPMGRLVLAAKLLELTGTWQSFTFFLNCLWMASSASLMVTPFIFRAVTSRPRGKCRSIFFTGGLVRYFLSTSFSSMVAGDVLSFLAIPVSIRMMAFRLPAGSPLELLAVVDPTTSKDPSN